MLDRFMSRFVLATLVALILGPITGWILYQILELLFPGEGMFYNAAPWWKVVVISFAAALLPSYAYAHSQLSDDEIDKERKHEERYSEAMQVLRRKQRKEIADLKAELRKAKEDG